MIVRISGTGQFEIDDACVRELDRLDTELTAALNEGEEDRFRQLLSETISLINSQGKLIAAERVIGSDVIVPPEDVNLREAQQFFTDEGLMAPLPA